MVKSSFNHFIGYINKTDAFPIPSCIKLSQMNGYIKYFDSNNNCMNLLLHNKELLKPTMKYGINISNLLKKGFDSEQVCNNKYIIR